MRIDDPVKQFAAMYSIERKKHIETIQLLMEGLSNEEMAQYFKVKLPTIKIWLKNILRKVNADKRQIIMSEVYKIALGGRKICQ